MIFSLEERALDIIKDNDPRKNFVAFLKENDINLSNIITEKKLNKYKYIIRALDKNYKFLPNIKEFKKELNGFLRRKEDKIIKFLSWDLCGYPTNKEEEVISEMIRSIIHETFY